MEVLEAIAQRSSPLVLSGPGPDSEQVRALLDAAVRAPDHGRLSPWRFVVVEGAGRAILGSAMKDCLQRRDPAASEAALKGEAEKALRAPTIITVAARITEGKIPELEQVMAVAAGVQNMMLAAHALGFGAMWKTGAAARDAGVKRALGLLDSDHIVAFVYVGVPERTKAPRKIDLDGLWWKR